VRDFNPAHVGFGSNSTELAQARISFLSVSYRIVGSAISGPQLTQEPKLLARKSPSRRRRHRGSELARFGASQTSRDVRAADATPR
jgi:hypothetical protein